MSVVRRANPSVVLRLLLLATGIGLGGTAGWQWTSLQQPTFASTAILIVSLPNEDARSAYQALRAHPTVARTFAAVATDAGTIRQLVEDEFAGRVALPLTSARAEPGTSFVRITAVHADPQVAAAAANALAERLVTIADSGARGSAALTLVEPATVAGTPERPFAPRDVALGAVAGGALAGAAAIRRRPRPRALRLATYGRRSRSDYQRILAGVALGAAILAVLALRLPDVLLVGLIGVAAMTAAFLPAVGLTVLALVLPIEDPESLRAFGLKLPIIAGLAYGCAVRALASRETPRIGVGWVIVLGFAGMALMTAVPMLSGLSGERAVAAAARFLQLAGGITIVAVATGFFRDRDPRPYFLVAVAATVIAALLAMLQVITAGSPWAGLAGLYPGEVANPGRSSGPFYNPNYFALFAALGLTMTLGVAGIARRHRPWLIPAAVVIAAAGVAALSRGAIIAAVVGCLALLWFHKPRLAMAAVVGVLTVLVVAYPYLLSLRLDRAETGASYTSVQGQNVSDADRWQSVAAGLALFRLDPVFGVGFGQYEHVSPRFIGSSHATSAHNQYSKVLAEQGVVGTILISIGTVALVRALRRSVSPLRGTAQAMLLVYAVAAVFLEPLTTIQTSGMLWLTLGAVLAGVPAPVPAPPPVRQATRFWPLRRASATAAS